MLIIQGDGLSGNPCCKKLDLTLITRLDSYVNFLDTLSSLFRVSKALVYRRGVLVFSYLTRCCITPPTNRVNYFCL